MSRLKLGLLILQGVLYVVAGALHFVNPDAYLPLMPEYLPAHLALIYISGVAEILGGVGLLVPKTRRAAAWGLVALLFAVWPANVHVALENVPLFGAEQGAGGWNWVRVVFQLPLLAWAYWFTRPTGGEESPTLPEPIDTEGVV
jgi:uncharacterized membrane protein